MTSRDLDLSSRPGLWTEQVSAAGSLRSAPMSAAPFLYADDGLPDWGNMWTSFCDLALHGGPPHRRPDDAVVAFDPIEVPKLAFDAVGEIQRGIFETTGLRAEPADAGWLSIKCESRGMAAWMCATIILENVDTRSDGLTLFVPASPAFELKDQVKSVITVMAKVHHYWRMHLAATRQPGAATITAEEVPATATSYRDALVRWGQARAARDTRSAADLHDQIHVLTATLAAGAAGRAAIEVCLGDPDVWVRLWSATESLAWAPDQARQVLEAIKETRATASIDAAWALLQAGATRE